MTMTEEPLFQTLPPPGTCLSGGGGGRGSRGEGFPPPAEMKIKASPCLSRPGGPGGSSDHSSPFGASVHLPHQPRQPYDLCGASGIRALPAGTALGKGLKGVAVGLVDDHWVLAEEIEPQGDVVPHHTYANKLAVSPYA